MVGGSCSHRFEVHPALLQRFNQARVAADVGAVDLTEARNVVAPVRPVYVDDTIGTKRWDNAALPTRVANGPVVVEQVGRRIGRGEHLDVEPLEYAPRAELRLR